MKSKTTTGIRKGNSVVLKDFGRAKTIAYKQKAKNYKGFEPLTDINVAKNFIGVEGVVAGTREKGSIILVNFTDKEGIACSYAVSNEALDKVKDTKKDTLAALDEKRIAITLEIMNYATSAEKRKTLRIALRDVVDSIKELGGGATEKKIAVAPRKRTRTKKESKR